MDACLPSTSSTHNHHPTSQHGQCQTVPYEQEAAEPSHHHHHHHHHHNHLNNHSGILESDSDLDVNQDPEPVAPAPRPGFPSVRPNAMHNRQRQLDMLRKHEDRLRGRNGNNSQSSTFRPHVSRYSDHVPRNPMVIHVLDISQVLSTLAAMWLPVQDTASASAPDETIFYSLIEGRGELILFGGVQRDPNSMQRINSPPNALSHIVSNGLFVISPKSLKQL